MHAATVVANHAAQRAPAVRSRIGSVSQVVNLRGVAQPVENQAGLHTRQFGFGIDRLDLVHVPRVVKDHGHIRTLPGQARAAPTRQNCGAGLAARGQRRLHIGGVARQNHAYGKLPVVGGIGGIKRARTQVEMHLAAHRCLQARLQFAMRRKALMLERRKVAENGKGWLANAGSAHGGIVARLRPHVL